MLNETLRKQVEIFLNGQTIDKCPWFNIFSHEFISNIIMFLYSETYSINDHIMEEGVLGIKMYFITKGEVILFHNKSHTFIKEIVEGEFFGERSFFSSKLRICSVQSKTFTEVLWIDHEKFLYQLEISERDQDINWKADAFIEIKWYVWGRCGHYSMECEDRWRIEGNLKRNLKPRETISEEEKAKYRSNSNRLKRRDIVIKDLKKIEEIKIIAEGNLPIIQEQKHLESEDSKDHSSEDEEFKHFSLSSDNEDSLNQSVRDNQTQELSTFAKNKNKTDLSNKSKILVSQLSASYTSEIISKDHSSDVKKDKIELSSKRMLFGPSILIKQFTSSDKNSN